MNKSGTSEQIINTPKGGGALTGIGETFSPDLHTGTGNFSIPITIPPGRNGFQPELNLVYSTGNGNSPFGLGWQLSVPGVERKTSKGIPQYRDNDSENQDTFILSGAEGLIPVRKGQNYVQYRPRTEGLFALIYRVRDENNDYWEVKSKDGLISRYGTPNSRGFDNAVVRNPDNFDQIFGWKLSETVDPFGNRIRYSYARDEFIRTEEHVEEALVDLGFRIGSLDIQSRSQNYLQRIEYLNIEDGEEERYLVSVEFNYEERQDSFSVFTSGFQIRTNRRCSEINVYTHHEGDHLVRSYRLDYTNDERTLHSFLSDVTVTGHGDDATTQQLPPLTFGYTTFQPEERDFYPVEGYLPAVSLGTPDTDTVDLFGNGLPDIIQMNGVVRYWRNRGNGTFDFPQTMATAPGGFSLADPNVQFIDANGEGKADLFVSTPTLTGYFPTNFNADWEPLSFRAHNTAPPFSFADPNVRLIDLDGNGVTDALRTSDRLELYYNDPEQGWNELRMVTRLSDLENFPDVYFSDTRVKLGDMTGDGLQDIILVHNGNVEYWPYHGYGRWGRRVHMQNSPTFPFSYNPSRILLGDINGNGTNDVIYVDDGRVFIWLNQNGNSFSDPIEIAGTPRVTDTDAVRLEDLNGTGIKGLLWTSNQIGTLENHFFFLDLTGSVKPYVLNEMDNHMGTLTRVRYRSSTEYYQEHDADLDTRWKTNLPFPVQVVSQVEVIDQISRGKLTSEYIYYHGYWDGAEREFRGFGKVEQIDTELFEDYNSEGLHPGTLFNPVGLEDDISFSPPTLTRTWFHQGPIGPEHGSWEGINSNEFYGDEFWTEDPQILTDYQELPRIETTPSARRRLRDAIRSLRGRVLRTEVYALDGDNERQIRPYTVTENQYGIRLCFTPPDEGDFHPTDNPIILPPKRNSGFIFFSYQTAQRTTQWERGNDPMTQLSFTREYDDFGQPQEATSIACPRTWRTLDHAFEGTQPFLTTYGQTDFAYSAGNTQLAEEFELAEDESFIEVLDAIYIKDRVAKTTSFEIEHPFGVSRTAQEIIDYPSAPDFLNIIGQTFNYYDGEAFEGLPLRQIGHYGAKVRSESLVLTEEILRRVYDAEDSPNSIPNYLDRVNSDSWPAGEYPSEFQAYINSLPNLAGYLFSEASEERTEGYYVQTARVGYDFQVSHSHSGNWGLPVINRDPLGRETNIDYDDYGLLPESVTTPLGLDTVAEYNYHFMQPTSITDPNGNRQHFSYTPLGLVSSIVLIGSMGEGDTIEIPGTSFVYNFGAFETDGLPVSVRTIQREYHVNDTEYIPPGHEDDTITTVEYSDGFGRLIQTRTQAEDVLFGEEHFGKDIIPSEPCLNGGESIGVQREDNVVVSGWQIYDNKGQVVQKYEPFFATGFDYGHPEEEQTGKAVKMFYDPRGQVIRTLNPDGSEQRVVYGVPGNELTLNPISFEIPESNEEENEVPITVRIYQVASPSDLSNPNNYIPTPWEAYTYDANDLAPLSFDENGLSQTGRAPVGHHFTPSSILINGLGKTVLAIERNRLPDATLEDEIENYQTLSLYDIRGNLLKIEDAKGRLAFQYEYDLANQNLRTDSIDAGLKGTILDVMGSPLESRDSKGAMILSQYDDLNRPTHLWARDNREGVMALRQLLIYGESLDPLIASQTNHRGQLLRHYDEAGLLSFHRYDFKGNLLEKSRRVINDQTFMELFASGMSCDISPYIVDWSAVNNGETPGEDILESSPFQTNMHYDALNRTKRMVYPEDVDGERKVLIPLYNRAGALESVRLYSPSVGGEGEVYVQHIAYNAKGQRSLIAYGNGVMTRYAYNENTFRLERLLTEQYTQTAEFTFSPNGGVRQDLNYAYDFAGNIIQIINCAPGSGVAGTLLGEDSLRRLFQYDANYRLIRAEGGREHASGHTVYPYLDAPTITDPNLARLYTERYEYDEMGNMTALHHNHPGGIGGFVRRYEHQSENNRLRQMTIGNGVATTFSYQYDDAGNMLREANRNFRWNHSNQLISFCNPPNENSPATIYAQYFYDATGQRTKKIVRTEGGHYQVTIYIDGVFELHRQLEPGGGARTNNSLHIMDDQQRIAIVRVGGAFPDDELPALQYHLGDHLGSSNVVLNESGNLVNTEEYTPYGETSFGSFARKRYRYSGKEKDEESGLYYYGMRYFMAWISKWVCVDPLAEHPNQVGMSPYSAIWNNPIKYTDPDGRCPDCPTLYTNTRDARGVVKNGFNATQYGKYSNYNWFSTTANASNTGRAGTGTTLGVEGINTSNAHTITKAQTTAWRLEAMKELGHTKEGLKALQASDPEAYGKAMSKINGSMYSKVGAYMDDMGKGVYHLAKDGTYAVSDAIANKGVIKTMQGSAATMKALNGMKIGGRVLGAVAVGLDLYEIHTSGYEPRTITTVAGGWAGAWAGAALGGKAGAWTGGGIGVFFVGVGTGPGAVIGGAIGSIGGGIGGYFAGREVTKTVYDWVTTPGVQVGGN